MTSSLASLSTAMNLACPCETYTSTFETLPITVFQAISRSSIMPGVCINRTTENLAVYGPRSVTESRFETSLYLLPPNSKTDGAWDCDGLFVPIGRTAIQSVLGAKEGPIAVKYILNQSFEIHQDGTFYLLPQDITTPNLGSFSPDEVCCPSNWPICVCWPIPNIDHTVISQFPEVPNYINLT